MGAYLSTPITTKECVAGSDGMVAYSVTAMQGWRRTMEDSHIATLDLNNRGIDIFGVFDGHGGSEVAKFCSKHMPDELLKLPEFAKGGDFSVGLVKLFLRMDEMLKSEEYTKEIEEYKGKSAEDNEEIEVQTGNGAATVGVSTADAISMLKRIVAMKNAHEAAANTAAAVTAGGHEGGGPTGGEAAANGSSGHDAATDGPGPGPPGPDEVDFFLEEDGPEDALPEHSIQAGCTGRRSPRVETRRAVISQHG